MSGLYSFLSGSGFAPESLQNQLQSVYEEFLRVVHATSGIVVLYSESEGSFIEVATVGMEDSDFFYEFMMRGLGNFEKVAESPVSLIFPKDQVSLQNPQSSYALVRRIFTDSMKGFILAEFPPGDRGWREWMFGLFVFRLEYCLGTPREIPQIQAPARDHSVAEILLAQIPSWESKFRAGLQAGVFSLRRKNGSGEKQVIRALFHRLNIRGDLVYLNTIPEQIIKLERYLSEWMEIAGSGFLVFEKIEGFTIAQQKLFTRVIPEVRGNPCFLFITDLQETPAEEYPFFWRMIRETEIYIPELPSLPPDVRKHLIRSLVDEIFQVQSKKGMKVEENVYEFLLEKSELTVLDEIRSVLELAILQSRGDTLKGREIGNLWTGKVKNLSLIDEEDLDLRKSVESIEKQKVLQAMKLFSGNQMRMSKALGISRGSLQYKMKQMGLL